MLIIKLTPEVNGAHDNNSVNGTMVVPDGWVVVPQELEQTAASLLPWVTIAVKDGIVTTIADDSAASAAWEARPQPEPEPTTEETMLELAADHEYRLCMQELGLS